MTDEEIEQLQQRVAFLEGQLTEQRQLVYRYSQQVRALEKGQIEGYGGYVFHETYYWQQKCLRQRIAINHIQKRGWYPPEYVIHEEDDPRDLLEAS